MDRNNNNGTSSCAFRLRTTVFLFFFLLSFPANAGVYAETLSLTLDDAVKLALDQSLNLKKRAVDLAQSEYSANRLWSEIFPSFSLNAGLTFLPSTPLFTSPGFSYRDENLSYAFNFGVSISLNPSLRSSMKRIELAYRSQLLSYDNAVMQLEIQVMKDFLGLVARKEYIVHLENYLEIAEQNMEKDRIARANGLSSELDWLNSQLSVQTAKYTLSNYRINYQNTFVEFLTLLGMEANAEIILRETSLFQFDNAPMLFDPEQLIMEYLPKRPDIIQQRQTIERLELSRSITALSLRSPTLELSTQWRGGSPTSGQRSGFNDPFTDSISGSLSLRIPIDAWIPGTRQNQSIRTADADLEKARLDLQNTETSAKTEIRSLVSNLRNTWENLAIARMRVDIAQRTLEATEEGFNKGTVEFRVLEDMRNRLSDARLQLLMGELSYQTLLLDLAAALNVEWKTLASLSSSEVSRILQ